MAAKATKSVFDRLLGCLVEFNVRWAGRAPVLLLSVAKLTSESTGELVGTHSTILVRQSPI